jgi:hypothetical protein
MIHKAAGSYPNRQMARPLESRQEYLRQEREQKIRERTECVIARRHNEDTQWISEQARLHHIKERGRSQQEPGQLPAGHITDQRHTHQDPVTVSMLESANDESMPVTNGGLATQEKLGQNFLRLEYHGPQEEEEVATLLGLQEPVGPPDMELDTDQELQYHWEAVGDSGGDIRGESSQTGCAGSGSWESISVREHVTSLDSDKPVSQSNPELAVAASPQIVWVSSQVDVATKFARGAVGPHLFLVTDNLLYDFQAKKDVHDFRQVQAKARQMKKSYLRQQAEADFETKYHNSLVSTISF